MSLLCEGLVGVAFPSKRAEGRTRNPSSLFCSEAQGRFVLQRAGKGEQPRERIYTRGRAGHKMPGFSQSVRKHKAGRMAGLCDASRASCISVMPGLRPRIGGRLKPLFKQRTKQHGEKSAFYTRAHILVQHRGTVAIYVHRQLGRTTRGYLWKTCHDSQRRLFRSLGFLLWTRHHRRALRTQERRYRSDA